MSMSENIQKEIELCDLGKMWMAADFSWYTHKIYLTDLIVKCIIRVRIRPHDWTVLTNIENPFSNIWQFVS